MKLNTQPIEKKTTNADRYYSVQSIFKTIQGEGPFSGKPAIFIRLAGCNLKCPGCDTDYTSNRRDMHVSDITERVHKLAENKITLVVITGGEPFRQDITVLCNHLQDLLGYTVQIETNGTLPPSKGLSPNVVIVCSPKTGKLNRYMAERADAFKYVLSTTSVNENDGLPIHALYHPASPQIARPPKGFKGEVYLQPMDEYNWLPNSQNQRLVVENCLKYNYTLQLQIHKIIGVQ